MATWDEVRRIAMSLPEVVETDPDRPKWQVRNKMFAWERPLRRGDLEALGLDEQPWPVLGIKTGDLDRKDSMLAEHPATFVTPHFAGYPALLIRLDEADAASLEELVCDAWVAMAPKRLAREFLAR